MDKHKITAQKGAKVNDDDRLALATLLIKMGYTVRIGKELREGNKGNTIYVEYSDDSV